MNLSGNKRVCARERQTAPLPRASPMLFGGSGEGREWGPLQLLRSEKALWGGLPTGHGTVLKLDAGVRLEEWARHTLTG